MTIQEFYKFYDGNPQIELRTKNKDSVFYGMYFYDKVTLAKSVDFKTKIEKFNVNVSLYGDYKGILFYISENDYNKIAKIYYK